MEEQIFKIGDKVRLKDYDKWTDYEEHQNEIATIVRHYTHGPSWDFHIKWNDNSTSAVRIDNIILTPGDWDD